MTLEELRNKPARLLETREFTIEHNGRIMYKVLFKKCVICLSTNINLATTRTILYNLQIYVKYAILYSIFVSMRIIKRIAL